MADRYFIINKPYNLVSQFKSPHKVRLLSDLYFEFPEGTHAIGRLDNESEGLLILTTDKRVTRLLYSGQKKHLRTYLVMVHNHVADTTLEQLQKGIYIPVKDGEPYLAIPESVQIVPAPKDVYQFATDEREKYPHTWLLITLTEGKFRQVRKMVMAVRHRCLRLIRVSIGDLLLGNMLPGEVRELDKEVLFGSIGLGGNF